MKNKSNYQLKTKVIGKIVTSRFRLVTFLNLQCSVSLFIAFLSCLCTFCTTLHYLFFLFFVSYKYFQTVIGDLNLQFFTAFSVSFLYQCIHTYTFSVYFLLSNSTDAMIHQSWILPTAQCYSLCHTYFLIVHRLFHHIEFFQCFSHFDSNNFTITSPLTTGSNFSCVSSAVMRMPHKMHHYPAFPTPFPSSSMAWMYLPLCL
jgi:hypothetical protein